MPDTVFAYQILDLALAHSDHLEMSRWVSTLGLIDIESLTAPCGTTACYAGWGIAARGLSINCGGSVYDSAGTYVGPAIEVAAELFNIDAEDADYLFMNTATSDLPVAVEEIFGPRPADLPALALTA
jgi:hypothetical protein